MTDLFDYCAARHGGVETSVAANARVAPVKTRQEAAVLALVRKAGLDGLTLREACLRLGKGMNALSGRFSSLHAKGLIRRTERRREGCFVWVARAVE